MQMMGFMVKRGSSVRICVSRDVRLCVRLGRSADQRQLQEGGLGSRSRRGGTGREATRTEGGSEMMEETSDRELGSEDGVDGEEEGGRWEISPSFVYGAGARCPKAMGDGVGAQPRRSTPAIPRLTRPMRK
jgi:hypothetical protein